MNLVLGFQAFVFSGVCLPGYEHQGIERVLVQDAFAHTREPMPRHARRTVLLIAS